MPTGSTTAERIVDSAESLFAGGAGRHHDHGDHRGLRARNKSAVAYHFGSKFDLLRAVLARHTSRLDQAARRVAGRDRVGGIGHGGRTGKGDRRPGRRTARRRLRRALSADPGRAARVRGPRRAARSRPRSRPEDGALATTHRRGLRWARPSSVAATVLIPSLVFHGLADIAAAAPSRPASAASWCGRCRARGGRRTPRIRLSRHVSRERMSFAAATAGGLTAQAS